MPRPTVGAWVGIVLLIVAVMAALLAPLIAPYDPLDQDVAARLRPPLATDSRGNVHLLGTDQLGRDILSRIIYGARVSLLVAAAAVPISLAIGTILGLTAGAIKGVFDDVIMRLLDVQLSLPFILLALSVLVALGPNFSTIVLLLGLTGWTDYGRLIRGEALSLRERDFVASARALGAGQWRIIFRHILPNATSLIVVLVTLQIPHVIILESALSFLGLGIQAPTPSWGNMLSEGRQYMALQWWVAVFPGLAISLVVLGGNLLGDWLRDVLDPRRALTPRTAS